MSKFEIVPGLIFVNREGWKPDTALPRLGGLVEPSARTHVIIHHTVTPDNDASPNVWEDEGEVFARMRALQIVRPDLGLDVPYNFIAFLFDSDALMICEGRGEDRVGAHTKGHNTAGIAISFAGNFESAAISDSAIAKRMPLLSRFLGWLKFSASLPGQPPHRPLKNLGALRPSGRNVFFHKDFKNTDCPGRLLEPHLRTVDFLAPELPPIA